MKNTLCVFHSQCKSLLLLLAITCFCSKITFAQPANDNCSNASLVNISSSGFGLGSFTSTQFNLTAATLQTGEAYASSAITAGINKKSIWYKFSLPTTRAVRISLAQPGSSIQNGDAGFAVYKTNVCVPGQESLSTKFTPIEVFGSSYHPCVESGDYVVQVTGNAAANGLVFITVETTEPSPAPYDKPASAYQFTNINTNKTSIVDFEVSCQSIDDAAENCQPNGTFKDFTKSTWHTFTTPANFDWFAVLLTSMEGNYSSPDYVVGFRLYKGNSINTPVSSLVPVGGCDSMKMNGYLPDKKVFKCGELLRNTTYTIQLLYHKDFIKTMRLAVAWNGEVPTKGPEPVSSLPSPNKIGVLPANSNGLTTVVSDNFGCNSRHSQHNCPKSMPISGVANGGYNYNMSSFFSFTLSTTTTLSFTTNPTCGPAPLVRLYRQALTANCSDLDTANIISTFNYNGGPLSCLDAGSYVLQVMGIDSTNDKTSLHWSSLSTTTTGMCQVRYQLGGSFNVSITAKTEVATNKFSLSAPGRFEKINANGAGVMQPLVIGTTYTAQPDTLGCANTVLPDNDICQPGTSEIFTKVTYREFTLSDSVLVIVPGYISSAKASKFFKGDANALATSQSAFSYPQKITGLQPVSGCFTGYSNSQNACLIPGTYTLANFDNRLGYEVTSKFTISQAVTKYNSAAKAQDMGDVWQAIDPIYNMVMSAVDTFTCHDNPLVIDGVNPCTGIWSVPSTKQIYRQFYLSKPALVSIFNNYYGYPYYRNFAGVNTLFSGKATDGISKLKSMGAKWTCTSSVSSGQCDALPAGWYTVVSYGVGPTYSNPLPGNPYNAQYSDVGLENGIFIRLSTACPTPAYNRPRKASIDTLTGKPYKIEWGPQAGHTAAYPVTSKKYTLNTENFDCSQDTSFINRFMQPCSDANVKVAFYVFQITQESYVQIGSLPYDFVVSVYNFDVRGSDSTRLKTDNALQPCLTNGKVSEFCKLQPGIYTLVIYGSAVYSSSCMPITPTIYIDQVGISRFDHAANAYDFGAIKPDSTWYNGKPGDVNPLNIGRAPSNDFFYCTAGASEKDPSDAINCETVYNPNIYASGNNIVLHTDNGTAPSSYGIDRRNLWYTFTINQPGNVKVRVKNKTPGKGYQYPFVIYKSDVNGTKPFAQVVSDGEMDSTLLQGLTYVRHNLYGSYCEGYQEVTFNEPPCTFVPTRYYIVVENRNPYGYGDVRAMNPNSQVEVEVLLDPVSAKPPKFDHYSQAFDMGIINSGIKKGAVDNFTCATRDLTDPINYNYVSNCQKTLWYKFTTTITGQIRYSAYFRNTNNYYYDNIQIFRQVKPNDSTVNGLQFLPYTTTYNTNGTWAQQCISPGTYYLLLPGCSAVDEDVYPQVEIIPQAGDFCSDPLITNLNGPGSRIVPVTIDCHTIGTDYGEFNLTLTCPAAAKTADYKTSWYRLDITGKDTLDVTVFINEKTNASSTDIKYRMMTGNCGAMQEQSCVQDALTRNTYKCLAPGNSYYIQVFTPLAQPYSYPYQVTGDIELNISAVVHADTCLPASNCIGVANFTPKFDCKKDREAVFTNYSTYGSSVTYQWDFGYNNQKSTAVSPSFFYPALTTDKTYTVKLVLTNTSCGKKDSTTETITIPARPAVNLGNDTLSCVTGTTIPLNATSHTGSTYYWYNGSTQPNITVGGIASPYVEVTYAGCKARDTINVYINPISKQPLQTKALCNVTTIVLNAARGQGEQYQWNTGASTGSITVAQPGTYWVDVYLKGCTIRDSFFVVSSSLKPLGNDTTICQRNMPFQLDATVNGANSYLWQNNSTTAKQNIAVPGIYWVDITLGGCTFRDSLVLKVDSFKVNNLSAKICEGKTYVLPSGKQVSVAGNYSDTLRKSNGCDSLITKLTLSVNKVVKTSTAASICAGQTFTLPTGIKVSLPGIYTDTIRYVVGCDSLITTTNLSVKSLIRTTTNVTIGQNQTYTLPSGKVVSNQGQYSDTVRYLSGCDSLLNTTNLTVNVSGVVNLAATICEGQSYILPSGKKLFIAGIYPDTLKYTTGFDSLITNVQLSVDKVTLRVSAVSICAGQTYTLPSGRVATLAGNYVDSIRYRSGCDSLISNITLSIKPLIKNTVNPVICQGQNYTLPSGKIISSTGMYSDTIHYKTGCDSMITMVQLTVKPVQLTTLSPKICAGQTYLLPSGKRENVSGLYRDTVFYKAGCDSIRYTINLSVLDVYRSIVTATICAGQFYTLPSGKTINVTGTFVDTVRYNIGCDSLISTTTITLKQAVRSNVTSIICAGRVYTLPSGKQLSQTGVFSDTLRYVSGCDSSISTVNLTVQTIKQATASASICQGQTYLMPSGKLINSTGSFSDTLRYKTGCDSVITNVSLFVTIPIAQTIAAEICVGETYRLPSGRLVNTAGAFTDVVKNSHGCDSLITNLVLVINPLPVVTITKSNDINCIIGSATLTAKGGSRYLWSPATGLNSAIVSSPVATPMATTFYKAKVTTAKGCVAEGSIELKVITDNIDGGYLLPSAFTPNSDGKNDCFGVKAWGMVSNLQFSIFDRWGHLLFSTTDPSRCWDGTYSGVAQSTAGYVYSISAVTACGPVLRKGTVVLIR